MGLRLAVILILLASGILGALAQFWAAAQAQAAAADLAGSPAAGTRSVSSVVVAAKWLAVVKFVTPAIFSLIFLLLVVELH